MPELIRESVASDFPVLEGLYPLAFPDEDLLPLLRDLFASGCDLLSLVAETDGAVVGHVVFTMVQVGGTDTKAALLGPVAVAPNRQKQGIGSALIERGFGLLADGNVSHIFVLGDPAYYGRFGFGPESKVVTPFEIPEEWREGWQSRTLSDGASDVSGTLVVPEPWNKRDLWAPPE
ncbi:N-acetyltransferase [Roseibium polysiphoniae]|uniref:GNAT family N-acetyltransferase n=1 Tax=Roseibium polysiphoniae TaxID=2571221 RepID=UPI003299C1E3